MASEEDSPSDGTSSPAASTSQEPQATPLDASDNLMCPICQDSIHDQASVSWCGHLFCYACILEWSCRRAVCPICRWPFYYIYRKVGDDTYVVAQGGSAIKVVSLLKGVENYFSWAFQSLLLREQEFAGSPRFCRHVSSVQCEMASEEDSPSDGTSSPAASTSQEPQATPLDASDNLMCPICQDSIHDQASDDQLKIRSLFLLSALAPMTPMAS
ncbi:hypothetical protein Q9966_001645 [Columba livia]|nr:hypothetical protein Q9966_001645 [Columba livia]